MFTLYRTTGIILGKKDRGETDRIFVLYTRDFGRLEMTARGERKINSKLRAGLEIFFLSKVEFIQGKTQKTITDAMLVDKFKNLRKDVGKLKVAYKISALTEKLLRGQEEESKIWKLLNEVFQKLDSPLLNESKASLIYYYFLWNFLSLLGYKLDFYDCLACHKKVSLEKLYLIPKDGGLVCEKCKKESAKAEVIDSDLIKIIRIFYKRDLATLSRLKVEETVFKNLESISKKYLSGILEKTQ